MDSGEADSCVANPPTPAPTPAPTPTPWVRISDKHCAGPSRILGNHTSYDVYEDARAACEILENCSGVYDPLCAFDKRFGLCARSSGEFGVSEEGSCVYEKRDPTPGPTPSPTPPTPSPTPSPTAQPTPSPTVNPTTPQPTPGPTPSPTPGPTPGPTPSPTPEPTAPTPVPTPSPTAAWAIVPGKSCKWTHHETQYSTQAEAQAACDKSDQCLGAESLGCTKDNWRMHYCEGTSDLKESSVTPASCVILKPWLVVPVPDWPITQDMYCTNPLSVYPTERASGQCGTGHHGECATKEAAVRWCLHLGPSNCKGIFSESCALDNWTVCAAWVNSPAHCDYANPTPPSCAGGHYPQVWDSNSVFKRDGWGRGDCVATAMLVPTVSPTMPPTSMPTHYHVQVCIR